MARLKFRPDLGRVITITALFGAVAGIGYCTDQRYFDDHQTPNTYRVLQVLEETTINGYGALKLRDIAFENDDVWQTQIEDEYILFRLDEFPPSHFETNICIRPFVNGRFLSRYDDLTSLNPVPCPE